MSTISINLLIPPAHSSVRTTSPAVRTILTRPPPSLKCLNIANPTSVSTTTVTRRSGNYNPPLWDFHYIQSLNTQHKGDVYSERVSELVAQVKVMLEGESEDVGKLELIDTLQNMGLSYHFEESIKQILNQMQLFEGDKDLYSTALQFRLLRQHDFNVSQDVFDCFKNDKGEFKASLADDTKGLLQLYEASFLLRENEEGLEEARKYSTKRLQKKVEEGSIEEDGYLSLMVRKALELPRHWRLQRLNVRWFIEAYASRRAADIILQLAKLEFNILQQTFQQELKQISRWWEETGLARKLPFARDRVVECYLWSLGELGHPQYGHTRVQNTKINMIITVIDDMFDIYGTLEELQLFNDIVQRWDIESIEQLPDYMQICFLALINVSNEFAYDILKEQGVLVTPYLKKSWQDLFKSYINEATWFHTGYKPTVEEYVNNGWISIGTTLMLAIEYLIMTNPIKKENVESLYKYHNIIQYSSTIVRLSNDLATSQDEMERGDVPKSVQCYMNNSGADREEAREYVWSLIYATWKKFNEEVSVNTIPFSKDFVTSTLDLARFGQFMYSHGDGHGVQNLEFKKLVSSLLFEPIV